MAKFKLTSGVFVYHQQRYKAGDVLEADRDLCRVFPNKFVAVSEEEAQARNKAGKPSSVPAGQKSPPESTAGSTAPVDPPAAPPAAPPPPPPPPAVPEGKNVTADFESAVDEDFRVYKVKDGFNVYDADDLSAPVNEKPVKKAEVEGVIKAKLAE